jgi:hypothetical protein
MASVSRRNADWIILVGINLTVPVMVNWKFHTGQVSRTVALASGLVSLMLLNATLVATIRIRDKRSGQSTPRGLIASAIGLALLSALGTAISLYSFSQQ